MPQQYRLPDGSVIEIPDDASPEERQRIAAAIKRQFGGGAPSPQAQPQVSAPPLGSPEWYANELAKREPMPEGGIPSLQEPSPEEEGTLLGSAWEGLQNIPRGARQFGLMALQGIEGLRTPGEDTQREKELRARLQNLMEEIDPKYRDANLAQLGMGLGQFGAMFGTSLIPGVGKPAAAAGAMLMMAGDAAGRIAEYEEHTGEDVSTTKEILALGAGLGLGLTEMMPLAKYGRSLGLFGKAAREVGEEAAESVILQTGKQFRASLLPTAVRQAVQEGAQEGLSELGMSATALMYNEDALAHAGSEALREALIGGQVGAIGDVLIRMATRGHGLGRMRYGNYKAGKELDASLTRMIESGQMDTDKIRDLITGPDLAAISQDLIDSGVDVQEVEAHPEYQEALEYAATLARTRAAIMRDPGTNTSAMEAANERQAAAERQVLKDRFKDRDMDEEQFKRDTDELESRTQGFQKQMGLLRTAIEMEQEGKLGVEPEVALEDPDALLTEKEINAENNKLAERQNALTLEMHIIERKEMDVHEASPNPEDEVMRDDYTAALGTESQAYRDLVEEMYLLRADTQANNELRERIKTREKEALPEDLNTAGVAGQVDYAGEELVSQLQLAVRPSQVDVETVTDIEVDGEIGAAKQQMNKVALRLERAEASVAGLERDGLTGEDRRELDKLTREQGKLQKQIAKESEEGLSMEEAGLTVEAALGDDITGEIPPEYIELDASGEPTGNIHFPTGIDESTGDFTYDEGEVLPDYQYKALLYNETVLGRQTVENASARLAEVQTEISGFGLEKITPQMRQDRMEATFGRSPYPEAVKFRGSLIDKAKARIATLTERQAQRKNDLNKLEDVGYRKGKKKEAVLRWETGQDPVTGKFVTLQDDVGSLVTQTQRVNLYRFVFDPDNPDTWPPEYETWMEQRSQIQSVEAANRWAREGDTGPPPEVWEWSKKLKTLVPIGYTGPPQGRRMNATQVRKTIEGILGGGLNTLFVHTGRKEQSIGEGLGDYSKGSTQGRKETVKKVREIAEKERKRNIKFQELDEAIQGDEFLHSYRASVFARSLDGRLLFNKDGSVRRKKGQELAEAVKAQKELVKSDIKLYGETIDIEEIGEWQDKLDSAGKKVMERIEVREEVGEPVELVRRYGEKRPAYIGFGPKRTASFDTDMILGPLRPDRGGFHFEVGVSREKPSKTQRDNGQAKIDEARNEIFSWWGQLGIAREIDESGRTQPVPYKWRNEWREFLLPSLESLGNNKVIKLVQKLRKSGWNITPDVIVEALRIKGFDVASVDVLLKSPFFQQLVANTTGLWTAPPLLKRPSLREGTAPKLTLAAWNKMDRGSKEAVLSRILRTEARPDNTKAGREARITRRELRKLQERPEALPKSSAHKAYDIKTLTEANERFEAFKKSAVKKIVAELGLSPSEIVFTADMNDVFSQVTDVVVNGAYELEMDADGNIIIEDDGSPKLKLDEAGDPIYRPGYRDGAVASLQKHGTRIVFNLSQIASKYEDGIHTNPDEIIKDITAHEGTHLLFLRNDLMPSESRVLDRYGRKKKVPKKVNEGAHRKGLTWRQWVESMYNDLSEDMLTEETSVHILDNLTMGKVPDAQAAGMIGKIKRQAVGMFKAIVGASQDADILPVMRVFEDIQSGAIAKRREKVAEAGDLRGAQALWLAERATPKDLKRLKEAMKEGDQVEVDRISDEIVTSRMDLSDNLSSEERLIESLTAELRARQEIEDTPTRIVQSVLNEEAIRTGAISPEALNAYFKFRDGRKGDFRIPVGDREKRWGWGGSQVTPSDAEQRIADGMDYIGDDGPKPATSIIDALAAHERMPDGTYISSGEDARTLIGHYSKRQFLRKKLFDKRLPQWLSSERTQLRGVKLYNVALGQLAETSAIAAWRFADNALNFIPGVMKYGMLTYANGGFNMKQLYVQERNLETGEWQDKMDSEGKGISKRFGKVKVKSLWQIFKPMIEMGKIGQKITLGYMSALRVRGVHSKRQLARDTYQVALLGTNAVRPMDIEEQAWNEAIQNYHLIKQEQGLVTPEETTARILRELRGWEDAYNSANKLDKETGERWIPKEKWEADIEAVESIDGPMNSAAMEFAERYGEFNHHLVEFAHQTGQITRAQADIMQSMPFIPFYRDQGWENDDTFVNPYNEFVEKEEMEGSDEEADLRGDLLIDRSIRGSFTPINNDLFGNITRNVNALIRDGMHNVAGGRSMRDELTNGTAYEIPTVDRSDWQQLDILRKKIRRVSGWVSKDDPPMDVLKEEYRVLEQKIDRIKAEEKRINKILDDKNFAVTYVRIKGVTRRMENVDRTKIRARLGIDEDVNKQLEDVTRDLKFFSVKGGTATSPHDVIDLAKVAKRDALRQEKADLEEKVKAVELATLSPQEGEYDLDLEASDIQEAGVHKTYRVLDPQLAVSIMNIGFSPRQAIEDFFHKTVHLPPAASAGISKLLVGASKVLREAVTRSPPFMIKNIIRDAMQATVSYGGGLPMFFRVLKNAVDPKIIERAEQSGLGIGVDWTPDPQDAGRGLERMLKREQLSWKDPTDWFVIGWETLGRFSKRSEVAARMAVFDDVMVKTGNGNIENGNAVEATNQAIEIINYGRRGSSKMFSTLLSMAPFMNGRIQGLDVIYRTHMGRLDAPGVFPGSGGGALGAISEEQRMNSEWARRATVFGRGSLIMLATGIYYAMVHDDEEYKNAREDMKNQWWLIPLGGGRPGIKIPIPFEVGTIYKIIPEQLMRAYFEDEHDLRDVRHEMRRQIAESLMFDLRPQLIRPLIDAFTNRDAYQRDEIVPSWMEDTVASTEHYTPYTNRFARLMGDTLDKIPFLQNVDFLTDPMKLEYMMRQYTGTLGAYGMAVADRVTRQLITKDNIVGTAADFGFSNRTWSNLPALGDLFYDPQKGGGYQEDFYELVEDVDKFITTLGQIEENRGHAEGRKYEEEHKALADAKARLQYFERRMKHYRTERDRLFERTDLSNEDKRRQLFRMFETRDDMLAEVVNIMADVREERSVLEAVLGTDI